MVKLSRYWIGIIYPGDSAPDNWQSIAESWAVPCVFSPLHTPSAGEGDDQSKPHRHYLIDFGSGSKKSETFVRQLTAPLHGTVPFVPTSVTGTLAYFAHLYNPDKEQFDLNVNPYICLSGFSLSSYKLVDDDMIINEIKQFILTNGICEFCDLQRYAFDNDRLDWCTILNSFSHMSICRLLDSVRNASRSLSSLGLPSDYA